MYLKTLELHGFKSFPNKTVLQFERGTTIVVGPNGSGKSNISDAMRWVLGEISSRNIRGTRMEDVIFGGTDSRRPMSFAEVSVTFDNSTPEHRIDSAYDEITVTRRYYRSGESEYMINRKNCRLKDIHNLFLNTGVGREGYYIIGQGKIAEILSKKSEDRRNIFEEAAGIARYRQDKEDSEKKLAAVERNVESSTLVFNELDARIGPLSRDAEKAKKYRVLLETKKSADVSLWLFDTQKIKKDLEAANDNFRLASAEYERLKETIETLEKQSDHIHDKLTGSRIHSEALLSKINETNKKINVLENSFQLAVGKIQHLCELSEQNEKRIEELAQEDTRVSAHRDAEKEKIVRLREEEEGISDEQLEHLAEMDEYRRAAERLEKVLEEKLSAIEAINQELMDLRVRLDVATKAKEDGAGKGEGILAEIEQYRAAEKDLKENVARCERSTASYKVKIDEAEKTIAEQGDLIGQLHVKREAENAKHNAASAQISGLMQRIESLKRLDEHFEGYQQSVRFVMQEYTKRPSVVHGEIYGPVSKLISTPSKYITAIETALGQNLQNIVVESEETAKSAIALLKNAGAGRATFYPVSAIRASKETDEIRRAAAFEGYIGRADTLISFDEKYREVMEWLLLRTVVFDNIDHATEAAKKLQYRVRIVTMDGQQINVGGAFTGGSVRRDSGILSRSAEVEALEGKMRAFEKEMAASEREIASLEKASEEARNKIHSAEQTRDLLYTMSRAQFSELDTANAKLEANASLIEKLEADYDRLTADDGKYDADIAALKEAVAASADKAAALRADRLADEAERQRLLDLRDSKNEEIGNYKLRLAVLGKEIEASEAMIATDEETLESHKRDTADILLHIAEYAERITALESEKTSNREELALLTEDLKKYESERSDSESDSSELDKRENELREKIRTANDEREKCFAEYTRSETKLTRLREDDARLENKLWDEYQITYEAAVALDYPPVTQQNRHEIASVQASCKAKIRELGNVNTGAIEEYEEVRARHEELKTQLDDLNDARAKLLEIIAGIESGMRTSFEETFNQINENFATVFSELFGGGQAELSLTNPEDVLTSGIEIKAAPPGKIIKSLSLLSGGEQTFVAIALIFAILKANPTPFCIFDEIEAALDEVNVDRFGAYVQKYSEHTQFVLITHRRGTMEIGDRLYGITMPERGISRAVPLDVTEIESKQKELLS